MSTVTTFGDLANRLHRMVKGSRRETFNILGADLTTSTTTVSFTQPTDGIGKGSYLGIGSEILYVLSMNSSVATVRRGMFNTDPAAHATNDLVEVDWRWFTADVLDALADDIRSWPNDIYQPTYIDIPVSGSVASADFPASNFRHALNFRRSIIGNDRWVSEPANSYRIDAGLPLDAFPSGYALYLPNTRAGAGTVRVDYAADFDLETLTASTLIEDIGLTPSLHDAALYGGAWRLLVDREPQRSAIESQPEPRQAADVREGTAANTGGYYKRLRDERLTEEARRLRGLYPTRFG